jgi:hypothetical protein
LGATRRKKLFYLWEDRMLNYNRILPALMLAAIMLVGCHDQPAGLPNYDVHVATLDTLVILVYNSAYFTGDVDHYTNEQTPGGWYETNYQDTIKWGFWGTRPYPYQDQHGFATFRVPPFYSPNELPVCTLHYYVAGCNASQGDSMLVNHFEPEYWTWDPQALFWAIDTSTATLAKDVSPTSTGWHKVALTSQGCGIIGSKGARGWATGDTQMLYTGWKYVRSPDSGWYTRVTGPDDAVSPYIVVIYNSGP